MSQSKIWQQIEHVDSNTPSKTVLNIYDDYAGNYMCNVPDAPGSFKPAAKTKSPFKLSTKEK